MTARARLWLDLALFAALFLGYNPAWTGLAVHEWLCVIAIVPLLFHVIINWDQTLQILRRFAEIVRATPKVNLIVDAALFVACRDRDAERPADLAVSGPRSRHHDRAERPAG